ncbi:hypothetical protein H920_17760 [Fukomys damarensis]|uniref:Uncharacterized protein n=1 Tax=Fukomys damarensis TaxID=885580 RepID=A0A091CP95_FUKDA|nr:hypothetical protein H920_17760 [Fukomys damarensis]
MGEDSVLLLKYEEIGEIHAKLDQRNRVQSCKQCFSQQDYIMLVYDSLKTPEDRTEVNNCNKGTSDLHSWCLGRWIHIAQMSGETEIHFQIRTMMSSLPTAQATKPERDAPAITELLASLSAREYGSGEPQAMEESHLGIGPYASGFVLMGGKQYSQTKKLAMGDCHFY